jgi:molybdopterin molybdotransferase
MTDFPTRISIEQAQQCIADVCANRQMPAEQVLLQHAFGRVLAEDVMATRNQPFFANSAMDGFALRGTDLPQSGQRVLRLIGTRLAGDQTDTAVGTGECLRITTGAPLPDGADTVVIKEHVEVDGESVVIRAGESAGSHVRAPGEDFRAGEIVARRGSRIGAAHVAALASAGLDKVQVSRKPRVAVLTTGDELVMPGTECGVAQLYNSNGFAIAAQLQASGLALSRDSTEGANLPFLHLRDEQDRIRSALLDASRTADVIITSGGVSAGEADFLPGLVTELGRIHFWKVRMRPGMPLLFGEIGGALVFCLPGNPVSTAATLLCLVQPGLAILQGADGAGSRLKHAVLGEPIRKNHNRTEFLRAVCEVRNDGRLRVVPVARQGSSMIRGLVEANALIMVPEEVQDLDAGEVVQILEMDKHGCER